MTARIVPILFVLVQHITTAVRDATATQIHQSLEDAIKTSERLDRRRSEGNMQGCGHHIFEYVYENTPSESWERQRERQIRSWSATNFTVSGLGCHVTKHFRHFEKATDKIDGDMMRARLGKPLWPFQTVHIPRFTPHVCCKDQKFSKSRGIHLLTAFIFLYCALVVWGAFSVGSAA